MRTNNRRVLLANTARIGGVLAIGPWLLSGSGALAADAAAPAPVARPANIGFTRRLEILPLVDWAAARTDLAGEAGVSYLIRTDGNTVLFDVGANAEGRDPSPLQANMQRLGVRLSDIDTIVISHPHMDHAGGLGRAMMGTFSLGNLQVPLEGKHIVVPRSMYYPGTTPTVAREPTVLGPGIVTTGPITGPVSIGAFEEQALAVRVQGKGVVLVVGCGHQGLAQLLVRTEQLFDEPLYGIVGGLHYPVPRGRLIDSAGRDLQRSTTYGSGPGPSPADVQREVDLLAARRPQWVSVSAHDSSDEMIDLFRRNFGERYHDLRVGEAQVIATSD